MARKPKTYPLSIWTWEETYAASWGHHDPAIFKAHLEGDWGKHSVDVKLIRHGWARVGFDGPERVIYNMRGPGRGVRPITEYIDYL